jgi:DNA polymerase-1
MGDHKNRNLQNVPPAMREVFRADNGIFTWADFGQIELRVLARLSLDTAMMREFAKESPDLHSMTANAGGISRSAGKTFNFARVFGAGDRQLSAKTGVPLSEVPRVRAVLAELFPESERWIRAQMTSHGDTVDTLYGRRMRLPEAKGDENPRAFAAHQAKCAVNYPVQGTAADIVKRAMLKVHESGVDLRLQVHDEYIVDGWWEPEPSLADTCPEIRTPFETKRGPVWS